MADRIQIINDALLNTGNNLCQEFDGSSEWLVGEMGYRRGVSTMLSAHRWGFAKAQWPMANLLPEPLSVRYGYSYAVPGECLHIEGLLFNGVPLTAYEIVGGAICCDMNSGVILRGVKAPTSDTWPLNFVEVLTLRVEAALYEGLNEDQGAAAQKIRYFETKLDEIKTEQDQQEPRRAVFVSRTALRRRGAIGRSV